MTFKCVFLSFQTFYYRAYLPAKVVLELRCIASHIKLLFYIAELCRRQLSIGVQLFQWF